MNPHNERVRPPTMSVPSMRLGSGAMFDRIAPRYDLLNRLMSMGLDHGWRRHAVRALAIPVNGRALDVATGTGDVALRLAAAYPTASIVGVDPSAGMLAIGRRKAAAHSGAPRVELLPGECERLPFVDRHFDGAIIAFGIRNVPDRAAGLREMARVTRVGGRVVILELGAPPNGLLAAPARLYVRQVVPRLGAWLSGAREYRYLQESIAAFPSAADFARLMTANGLAVRTVHPFAFGVCTLFVGEVAG
jgi:demethylmenaquinone methyltransferase/2-methoxy-6-polyprenyl-1,4-benzoquinol methylase